MMENLISGFFLFATIDSFVALGIGVFIGVIVGAIPGLTTPMAVALTLPFTFTLPPVTGILLLLGVYKGGIYGGSITAILINAPGTPAASCTVLDGYPMAKKGEAKRALDMALYSSCVADFISNIALIFGVSCLYLTGPSKTQLWNLMPFGLSVVLLGLTLADGAISVNESMGFVGILMIFMFVLFKTDGLAEEDSSGSNEFGRSLFMSLIGLVALVAGANIAVIYAENTALLLGVPKLIIGLTIIALGTSLPELAATIATLRKGKHQMVVGNIIGSNVFNLVFIIPMIGFFGSVELSPMVMQRDFYILLALSMIFILLAVVLTKLQFRKNIFSISGVVLIASYVLYISALSGII